MRYVFHIENQVWSFPDSSRNPVHGLELLLPYHYTAQQELAFGLSGVRGGSAGTTRESS